MVRRLCFLLPLIFASLASAAAVYIAQSAGYRLATWKYLWGTREPAPQWRERAFDDASWAAGLAPLGYGVKGYVRYGTDLDPKQGGEGTLFLRQRFFVDDLAQTRALKLSVNYTGGFVAWINGVKVAARNAPESLSFRSVATADHAVNEFQLYEVIAVERAALQLGDNVLAVQLLAPPHERAAIHFDASLVDTRNLAFNHKATASSVGRNARNLQPYTVTDGTRLTFFATNNPPATEEWLAVDLGETHEIDKARLAWWGGERPSGSGAKEFALQVSDDARKWQTVTTVQGHGGGEDVLNFTPTAARHVRILMTAGYGNAYAMTDFEVYARGVPFDPRECESLAFGKPAKVSSSGAPKSWPAAKLTDGNPIAWWVSRKGELEPQWLEIDLEQSAQIAGAKIYFGENFARKFTLRLATEPGAWRAVNYATETEDLPGGDTRRICRLILPAVEQARFVRIEFADPTPQPDHVVVQEVMVIAAPSAPRW